MRNGTATATGGSRSGSWGRGRGRLGTGGGSGGGRRGAATRLAARSSVVQNAVNLLGVSAAIVDVGVGETSSPHHHTSKVSIGLVLVDNGGELVRGGVVDGSAGSAVGTESRSRHSDEDLGVLGRSVGNEAGPVVVVERSVAVDTQSTGDGVVVVVIELLLVSHVYQPPSSHRVPHLNPDVIELRGGDDFTHVGLGNGALGCSGNVTAFCIS